MKKPVSKYATQTAWNKAHTRQIKAKLNENTDSDIIEWIEQKDNIAGYIKELIRADMANKKK